MEINLNLNFLSFLFNPIYYYYIKWFLIAIFLYLFLWIIFRLIRQNWLSDMRRKFLAKQEYIILSVNIPRDNDQGPESIERLFASFSGIKTDMDWIDKYFYGKSQLSISVEIASIEGKIQFYIRMPVQFKDVVESAIYTSYPLVEIFEVDDYVNSAPDKFPDEKYDIWGSDIVLYNSNPYPIKTYPAFEHQMSKELKDPMGNMLEILSKLQSGEQAWFQIITPAINKDIRKQGKNVIKKIKGKKIKLKKLFFEKMIYFPVAFISKIIEQIFTVEKPKEEDKKIVLTPGERRVLDAVEAKLSKTCFNIRIRLIYLATKEVFNENKGVIGVLSALKSINTLDMNGLMPDKKLNTRAVRIIPNQAKISYKKTAIIKAYKKRAASWSFETGTQKIFKKIAKLLTIKISSNQKKDILNIEELATIYHFPCSKISSPLIKKTGSKKGEPPFNLPTA